MAWHWNLPLASCRGTCRNHMIPVHCNTGNAENKTLVELHNQMKILQMTWDVSEELRQDKDVVLQAVKINGGSLQYTSEELRRNRRWCWQP